CLWCCVGVFGVGGGLCGCGVVVVVCVCVCVCVCVYVCACFYSCGLCTWHPMALGQHAKHTSMVWSRPTASLLSHSKEHLASLNSTHTHTRLQIYIHTSPHNTNTQTHTSNNVVKELL